MTDVVFRRINGRVIPIRKPNNSMPSPQKIAVGAAAVVAGVAGSVFAGKFAAKLLVRSAAFENVSRTAGKQGADVLVNAATRARAKFKSAAQAQMAYDLGAIPRRVEALVGSDQLAVKQFKKVQDKALKMSELNFHARNVVRKAGVAASGAIAGFGVNEIHKGATGKKSNAESIAAAGAAGTFTAALVHGAYYKDLGATSFKYVLKALRQK